MLKVLALFVAVAAVSKLVWLGMNGRVSGRAIEIASPAVSAFLGFTAMRHPRFGWSETPMGRWDVVIIAAVSLLAVALSQFAGGLFRRAREKRRTQRSQLI